MIITKLQKYEKSIFRFLTAIVVCGLAMTLFTQCHREEEDDTATDNVRLTQIYAENLSPASADIMFTTTKDFVWENGLLKNDHATVSTPSLGIINTIETNYYYSGNNCIEIHTTATSASSNDDIHKYFTYNGERMTKAVEIEDGDTIRIVTIHSYTDDGHVKSMTFQGIDPGIITDYELTWENGDLTKYRVHHVVPSAEDETYAYSYDNYPSVYTGVPLVDYIFAPNDMAFRGSKHNCLTDGEENTYANGRLVAVKNSSMNRYYTFSDGTTGRP